MEVVDSAAHKPGASFDIEIDISTTYFPENPLISVENTAGKNRQNVCSRTSKYSERNGTDSCINRATRYPTWKRGRWRTKFESIMSIHISRVGVSRDKTIRKEVEKIIGETTFDAVFHGLYAPYTHIPSISSSSVISSQFFEKTLEKSLLHMHRALSVIGSALSTFDEALVLPIFDAVLSALNTPWQHSSFQYFAQNFLKQSSQKVH